MVTAPGFLDPPPPPPPAQSYGANSDRRDARFAAPPARAVIPPMPANLPPAPPRAPAPPPPEFVEREHTPIVMGKAEPPMLTPSKGRSALKAGEPPPYPGAPPEQKLGLPPARAVSALGNPPPPPPVFERTDPRIVYKGNANRKVLDALKKVKRADPVASPAAPKEEAAMPIADVLAKDTLQVALRMEQSGRLDEAIRFLEKSIAQSPEAASLYNRLGIILMRERADYRRAEILIRKATELAPDNTVYATNLQQVIQQQAMRANR